jgi:hypothetical protein
MKVATIALVVIVSIIETSEAYYGYGYGRGYGYGYGRGYGYGSYGYYWGKRDAEQQQPPVEVSKKTGCIYDISSKMLECFGAESKFECEVEFKWESHPMEFELFGIGIWKEPNGEMKFRLIPRKMDDSAWVKDYVKVDGVKKYFSMFYSEHIEDFGLKVKDSDCFEKVVDLFKSSPRHETIYIENKTDDESVAVIVGDLIFVNRESKSKRYYGYGYGYYSYPYYSYYSYGYPYSYGYYYGKREAKEMNESDDKYSEHGPSNLRDAMEKGWQITERNTERMVREIEDLKKEIESIRAETQVTHTETVPKRSSMWRKHY